VIAAAHSLASRAKRSRGTRLTTLDLPRGPSTALGMTVIGPRYNENSAHSLHGFFHDRGGESLSRIIKRSVGGLQAFGVVRP
jgi:hypothetical protein